MITKKNFLIALICALGFMSITSDARHGHWRRGGWHYGPRFGFSIGIGSPYYYGSYGYPYGGYGYPWGYPYGYGYPYPYYDLAPRYVRYRVKRVREDKEDTEEKTSSRRKKNNIKNQTKNNEEEPKGKKYV